MDRIFKGLLLMGMIYTPFAFSAKNKNTVIIKNNASSAVQQQISAPALVPSEAQKLRDARQRQEIQTEDAIIKELEKQRILDEQKRINRLFKRGQPVATPQAAPQASSQASAYDSWLFGQKSFISLGAGFVSYPNVLNINSTEHPALSFSFGGYGYEGNLIFDVSVFFSRHYLKTPGNPYDVREFIRQWAPSMSVKYSPLQGKMKPYLGLSGSVIWRWISYVDREGIPVEFYNQWGTDVGDKKLNQSADVGLALGADVALGTKLGLNVDLRYHVNFYTENLETLEDYLADIDIIDRRNSVIFTANLRYYF